MLRARSAAERKITNHRDTEAQRRQKEKKESRTQIKRF
jgi:hypothetical protein